jgi:hypothetical protein
VRANIGALAAVVVAAVACRAVDTPAPGSAEELASYLRSVVGADEGTRLREVASWRVPEDTWQRVIVEPFRRLGGDYAGRFEAASQSFVPRLAAPAGVTVRRHYAGDSRLTRSQARLRWTVPVQYPSMVAEVGGTPLDIVFIYDGHWRALIGLDDVLLARIRDLDPACGDLLAHAGPAGRCTEVAWGVADAGLRGDRAGFAHACQLASTLCGNRSP